MPHFIVEYSSNLAAAKDMHQLAQIICNAAVQTGVFPLGGIRVRLYPSEVYAIADKHEQNAFVAINVRMGAGRDLVTKKQAGQTVFDAVAEFFSKELEDGYFMLSLDITENDPEVSFKKNSVHGRLKSETPV